MRQGGPLVLALITSKAKCEACSVKTVVGAEDNEVVSRHDGAAYP